VRFALLETKAATADAAPTIELVLSTGERLRIGNGVDAATLRLLLDECGDDPPAGQRAGVSARARSFSLR
jgi:hypothetical protein